MLDHEVPAGTECLCCHSTTGCAGCYCEACDGDLEGFEDDSIPDEEEDE